MANKDFITKKIKVPKGYKTSELVGDDSSSVIVYEKKKGKARNKRKQPLNILKTTSSYIGSIHRIKILKNKH